MNHSSILPNLLIIGAAKCGTTGMHYYLGLHPEIFMSKVKELDCLVKERNWRRGVRWYQSNFSSPAKIHGEATPNYANYPIYSGVPERIHSLLPSVKMIYMVRDPLDRIFSHYIQRYANRFEDRSLTDSLKDFEINPSNPYVVCSLYDFQLSQYAGYFPIHQILVVALEDLKRDQKGVLRRIFQFLGVDGSFYTENFLEIKHSTKGKKRLNRMGFFFRRWADKSLLIRSLPASFRDRFKPFYTALSQPFELPQWDPVLRQELAHYIQEDIRHFRNSTGQDFKEWCV